MTQKTYRTPTETIRDGTVEASICGWRGPEETTYTVRFTSTVGDKPGLFFVHNSYTDAELVQLARLADRAHDRIAELRRADAAARKAG
jgi:hypothetical protein